MTAIDIESLQGWVGKQRVRRDILTAFPAQALAAALGLDARPAKGEPLPLGWHWLYFHEPTARSATDLDGHPRRGEFLPPTPLPRRMWAAGKLFRRGTLLLGEPAQLTSTISAVQHKRGNSGELVFVEITHEISQHGSPCVLESQTLVYRGHTEGPAGPGRRPTETARLSLTLTPDPVMLFRYSALTYNSHRIHYDRDYAVTQEHYPGLVVHGPLQATLLLDLAHRFAPRQVVAEFQFKAMRPVFDGQPLQLQCARTDRGLDLWTLDQQGFMGLMATATLQPPPEENEAP
jgi:3-methylfumaryl-CoA hydratase